MTFWRAVLSGAAQLFYCHSPTTGAWLLLGVALLAPPAALAALLGLLAATAMARARRWNRQLWTQGLFGYNGAMVGLAWPMLFPLTSPGFVLVVPAAMAATWLQGRILPAFTRHHLPVLGVPFVLVIWITSLLFTLTGGPPVWIIAPEIAGPQANWGSTTVREVALVSALEALPGAVAMGIGLWKTSRATLGAALLGLLAGLVGALTLGGLTGGFWVGAHAYTAVPLALGIAGVFFPLTIRTLALAAGMSLLGVAVWVVAVWTLAPVGLFPLTAVAHAMLLGLLWAARSPTISKAVGIHPRPLAEAVPPRAMVPSKPVTTADPQIAQLVMLLRRSSRTVAFSGAGMSTESGVPDYRTQVGFWYDANPEDLVYSRFVQSEASRRLYWRLYRRLSRVLDQAVPHTGHRVLAELEREGKLLGIITQNVDGLHQASGVAGDRVVELHGNARAVICLGCGHRTSYSSLRFRMNGLAPRCDRCGGLLKADTVSVGEQLDPAKLAQAVSWCNSADLLLIIGTSLQVVPAGTLPELVRSQGVPVVVINRTPTPFDPWATLVVRGPAAAVLDEARRSLMSVPPARVIRPMTRTDFQYLCRVVDYWWGDQVRYLLHPLYLEHFPQTCLVSEEEGVLAGFLIGFVSQARPDEAYVHLVATAPAYRRRGIGRALYEHFFAVVQSRGCAKISAITVPFNETAVAFHRRMGFQLREEGAAWVGGVPFFPDYAGPGVDCVSMECKL